jgi:ficolin
MTFQLGQNFSTYDKSHNPGSDNCALLYHGAWWYNHCHQSNLNGNYLFGNHSSYADGIEWFSWTGYYYSMKTTEMKIRPINY